MSGENVERFSSEDVSFMSSVTLGPAPPETEVTPPADASEGQDDKLALEPGEAPQ